MASAGNAYRHENAVAVDRAAKTAPFSFEISLITVKSDSSPENYGHFPIPCSVDESDENSFHQVSSQTSERWRRDRDNI